MIDSLSQWLALREPADVAARLSASDMLEHVTRAIAGRHTSGRRLNVLDLAAGTGANLRFLAARLPAPQRWLLVDHDPVLLSEIPARVSAWAVSRGYEVSVETDGLLVRGEQRDFEINTRRADLGALEHLDIFSGVDLVTASALLDLVSERWLRALAAHCRRSGAAALFAINYSGLSRCTPIEPEDDLVLDLFNEHQGRDKGLGGPAAGPDAVDCAERAFLDVDYHVQRKASDWVLSDEHRELQRQLIVGWAEAASETAPERSVTIHSWLTRRLSHVEAGRSRVIVCHEDVAAWPAPGV